MDKALSVLPSQEQTEAFESIQKLNLLLSERSLVKKTITEDDINILLLPMQSINWVEKKEYADSLISILKSTELTQEIIEKAKAIQKERFGIGE